MGQSMSAKHNFAGSEALLPPVDYATKPAATAKHDLMIVSDVAAPDTAPRKHNDPLADIAAMSEEEKIALFS
jgi:hypothetical protein